MTVIVGGGASGAPELASGPRGSSWRAGGGGNLRPGHFGGGCIYGKHVPAGDELITFSAPPVGAYTSGRWYGWPISRWSPGCAGSGRIPSFRGRVCWRAVFAIHASAPTYSPASALPSSCSGWETPARRWTFLAGGLPDVSTSIILLGGRFAMVPWATALATSIVGTLGIFMLFFLCRFVARNFWLGCGLFVLVFVVISTLSSQHPAIDAPAAIVIFSLMTFVMVRFGLVTFAAMTLVNNVLNAYPLTWDFSQFYATSSLFAVISVAVVAGVAFHYALGGRAILGDDAT